MRGARLALCAALLGAPVAHAQTAAPVWFNPGLVSYHFDRDQDLRESNPGLGAEVHVAPAHVLMAGTFVNSHDERTRYAAYQWRPLRWRLAEADVGAGIALGVFDGYPRMREGGSFVGVVPLLGFEGERLGANIAIVPTIRGRLHGAVAFQVKLRVR